MKRIFRVSNPDELRAALRKAGRWTRWGIAAEIRLAPGVYVMPTEPLAVPKRVTLKGTAR